MQQSTLFRICTFREVDWLAEQLGYLGTEQFMKHFTCSLVHPTIMNEVEPFRTTYRRWEPNLQIRRLFVEHISAIRAAQFCCEHSVAKRHVEIVWQDAWMLFGYLVKFLRQRLECFVWYGFVFNFCNLRELLINWANQFQFIKK